jgi:hypothetical protein
MEIFNLAYTTFIGLLVAFSDLMSLSVTWILLGIITLFGCFTVGNISDHINKIINVSEEDKLFYGKIKLKYPMIRVTLNEGVHPIIVIWATLFYLLVYSLLHKYNATDFTVLSVCIGVAIASTLINWFRLNMDYAKSYSDLLNSFFKSRTKVDVKLVTAIRFMLNELYSKLTPEFAKFCSCHPYLDSENAMQLQLREVLDSDKNKYVDYLGLHNGLELDIANFISGNKYRIRCFLNEKFVGLWPEHSTRNLNFDVLFIKDRAGQMENDITEVIIPMIVFSQSNIDLSKLLYSPEAVGTKTFLGLEAADNLRRQLLKLNIYCIVLGESIDYLTPYKERSTDEEAINSLVENLRTSLALKPKDNKWFICNFFISWPFYVLNFLTFQMLSKTWKRIKAIASVALIYISRSAVKDL